MDKIHNGHEVSSFEEDQYFLYILLERDKESCDYHHVSQPSDVTKIPPQKIR